MKLILHPFSFRVLVYACIFSGEQEEEGRIVTGGVKEREKEETSSCML